MDEIKGRTIDRILFNSLAVVHVIIKRILTLLGLRNMQSCKRCGRNTIFTFTVDDSVWNRLPDKYKNKVLCFECFLELHPDAEELDLWKEIREYCIVR